MWTRRQTIRRVAALFAPPALRAASPSIVVPFQYAAERGSILIHARINKKPALLVVDTGSSHTIVRPALLDINPAAISRASASAGVIGDAIGQEVSLELGGDVWSRRRVSVMDLTAVLAAYKEPIDGLLGLDFLFEFSQAILNLKERKVTFVR